MLILSDICTRLNLEVNKNLLTYLSTVSLLNVQHTTHHGANPTSSQKVYVLSHIGSKMFCSLWEQGKGHKTCRALQPHQVLHPDRVRNAFHFSMNDLKINQNTAIYQRPALLITVVSCGKKKD